MTKEERTAIIDALVYDRGIQTRVGRVTSGMVRRLRLVGPALPRPYTTSAYFLAAAGSPHTTEEDKALLHELLAQEAL